MAFPANQIAVVTGASSGIGRAISLALMSAGTRTCMVGRDIRTLNSIAAQFDQQRVRCYQTDLSSDRDIQDLASALSNDMGRVDILIHSAGVFESGLIENAPVASLDRQYLLNVRAPFLLTQFLLPMIIRSCGQIIFINSSAGLNAKPGVGPYSATKHALKAIADSLRAEVNGAGVRVLSVYPGRTATPLMETLYRSEQRTYRPGLLLQPEDIADVIVNALSLPRTAEVTDINVRPMQKG